MSLEILRELYLTPTNFSVLINVWLFLLLWYVLKYASNSSFTVLFELFYEKMYDFFIDILGEEEKKGILTFVITLFFIILIFNFQSLIVEFIAPIMWMNASGGFLIEHYIIPASADINFNIAMSFLSILLIVVVQFSSLWIKDFFGTYFPITGKNYVEVEKEGKSKLTYILMYIPVKAFDIVISMFLGLLDLVGLLAKIVSLSFRLFGNMTSGTVLLAMTVVMMSWMTQDWFGFSFPVVLPVIVYAQEMLVGAIQALVFSLLVAIFIKMASPEGLEHAIL